MPRKKLNESLVMTTIIEREQHERLRELAFAIRATMAELVRDALDQYLKSRTNKRKVPARKR
jgi:hypothetical protein